MISSAQQGEEPRRDFDLGHEPAAARRLLAILAPGLDRKAFVESPPTNKSSPNRGAILYYSKCPELFARRDQSAITCPFFI